ncbi:acyltransferase family protein [Pseudomonas matsuisoli]|uniref:Acyltransferase n=1 Tax=Pseudomonas matsuisoli TaxID=1515666 RepID=A0A917PXE1_9PSED|nr:acyltransferase family protein [Pseudomonas matsuisoli]GGJ98821.1 acyltransferase [Pseudomonas matsuisoli]
MQFFKMETDNSYREDIQGVRAIGALFIAVYHIWLAKVSGGVDVFFVISGFLMASVLTRQYNNEGRLQPLVFWGNLVRRIAPSAYFVLFCTLVLSYFFIPEPLWAQVIKETVHSAVHYENIGLMRSLVDYLARDNPPSPVQQFWALSIQIQFYALLPFLLMGAFWLARRAGSITPVVLLLGSLIALSFVYSVIATTANPAPTYFNPLARAWEFLLGSLLAFLLPHIRLSDTARTALASIGLFILLFAGLLIPVGIHFPGYIALVPVAAALFLIVAGAHDQETPIKRLLSHPKLVALGGVSFTLYLWHWPLLVFARELNGGGLLNLWQGLVVIALSIVLAFATTRLVERPLRQKNKSKPRGARILIPYAIGVACVMPVLAGAGVWRQHVNGIIREENAQSQAFEAIAPPLAQVQTDTAGITRENFIAVKDVLPDAYGDGCHQDAVTPDLKECAYGDEKADTVVALVGGSHSAQWLPALNIIGQENGLKVVNMTKSDCPFGALDISDPSCAVWNEHAIKRLEALQPDVVVTTSTRAVKDSGAEYVPESYVKQWRTLEALDIPVVAIRDNPSFDFDVINCISRHKDAPQGCAKSRDDSLADADPAEALEGQVANLATVDMSEYLCTADTCPTVTNDYLMYRDWQHLNVPFVVSLTTALSEKLAAAEPDIFEAVPAETTDAAPRVDDSTASANRSQP